MNDGSTLAIEALDHEDAGHAIARLAVPSAFAFLGDQLLGIVDTIAIGVLGTDALAGITVAMSLFMIFAVGLYGFGSGLRILGAQAIGLGRAERFGTIVRSSIVVPLAVAIVVATGFSIFARQSVTLLLPPHVAPGPAAAYLAIRAWSLVPMVFTNALLSAFATTGNTKVGVRVLAVINLVHIPLLLVLALGTFTHRPFGLAGAATSSLIAECCAVLFTIREVRKRPELQIFASARTGRSLVRATAILSWPDFVFLVLQLLPDPIALALLAPLGAQVVAAQRALQLVNGATWALPGPLGDACETILGQRIGAGDYAGARAFRKASRRIALRVGTIVGAVIAALSWPLSALFTLDPTLATIAFAPLAVHVAVTLPLKSLAMVNVAPIRAAGDTAWVMRMGIVTAAISTAGIAFGIVVLHVALWSLPLGFTCGWIYRNLVTARRLRSGDWERRGLHAELRAG